MAKKRLTPAQLRDKKMKRVAIVLSVVFVAVMAYQAPTILNELSGGGGSSASPLAPVTTASANGSPSATLGSSNPALAGSLTSASTGSLTEFGSFAVKDPFHAQVGVTPAVAAGGTQAVHAASTPKSSTTPAVAVTKPKTAPKKHAKPGSAIPVTGPASTVPFTTAPATPPNAAVIVTNGKRQIVPLGHGFPRGAPLFKLVSLATHPKAIRIAVLGGSFTSGAPTLLLRRGAKLELADQSDGFRYTIMLVGLMATGTPGSAAPTSGSGASGSSG